MLGFTNLHLCKGGRGLEHNKLSVRHGFYLHYQTNNVFIPESPTAALTASSTIYRTDETAILTCTITGHPISTVQISLEGGSPLTTTKVSSTEYTASIGSFSVSDNGKYTCSVSIEWYKGDGGNAQTKTETSDLLLEYGKFDVNN